MVMPLKINLRMVLYLLSVGWVAFLMGREFSFSLVCTLFRKEGGYPVYLWVQRIYVNDRFRLGCHRICRSPSMFTERLITKNAHMLGSQIMPGSALTK